MNLRPHRHLVGCALAIAACGLLLSGCLGFGGGAETTETSVDQTQVQPDASVTGTSLADLGDEPLVVSPADEYSNFQSKDPFIQQAEPTTSTTSATSSTTTSTASTTTTTTSTPTSSTSSTSTSSTTSSSTTSSSTTSTTSFFSHMLQIIAVGDVDGTPAVTFQVDNNVYEDQRVQDKVSTSWGDVTVVSIDSAEKKVTLLHGGETITMTERQIIFE